jgi:hypothetical protein
MEKTESLFFCCSERIRCALAFIKAWFFDACDFASCASSSAPSSVLADDGDEPDIGTFLGDWGVLVACLPGLFALALCLAFALPFFAMM